MNVINFFIYPIHLYINHISKEMSTPLKNNFMEKDNEQSSKKRPHSAEKNNETNKKLKSKEDELFIEVGMLQMIRDKYKTYECLLYPPYDHDGIHRIVYGLDNLVDEMGSIYSKIIDNDIELSTYDVNQLDPRYRMKKYYEPIANKIKEECDKFSHFRNDYTKNITPKIRKIRKISIKNEENIEEYLENKNDNVELLSPTYDNIEIDINFKEFFIHLYKLQWMKNFTYLFFILFSERSNFEFINQSLIENKEEEEKNKNFQQIFDPSISILINELNYVISTEQSLLIKKENKKHLPCYEYESMQLSGFLEIIDKIKNQRFIFFCLQQYLSIQNISRVAFYDPEINFNSIVIELFRWKPKKIKINQFNVLLKYLEEYISIFIKNSNKYLDYEVFKTNGESYRKLQDKYYQWSFYEHYKYILDYNEKRIQENIKKNIQKENQSNLLKRQDIYYQVQIAEKEKENDQKALDHIKWKYIVHQCEVIQTKSLDYIFKDKFPTEISKLIAQLKISNDIM